jgi:hypothetical protein
MKVKAVNREPVSRPGGALALQGGEEVSSKWPLHIGDLSSMTMTSSSL